MFSRFWSMLGNLIKAKKWIKKHSIIIFLICFLGAAFFISFLNR